MERGTREKTGQLLETEKNMEADEAENESEPDADEVERLKLGMDRLLSWMTANGAAPTSCTARRARVLYWELGFDNKSKSWADFSRRYGDSEQVIFEVRKDFTATFKVGFAGGYVSKNKREL